MRVTTSLHGGAGNTTSMEASKSKRQKIYAYVDESGQDTGGEMFFVSVIIAGAERDVLRKHLREIELRSGKREKKWTRSTPLQRRSYLRAVFGLPAFRRRLYFSHYHNTKTYLDLTIFSTAKALIDFTHHEPYSAVVTVDGLGKSERHSFAAGLRKLNVAIRKVRGVKDQSDEFIRLADALAGFARDGLSGDDELQEFFQKAKDTEAIREI
jgi:hypothetical protein